MGKKEFAVIVLDSEHETFIVHVASFSFISFDAGVYLSRRFQIASLIAKKTLTKVPIKYADFANVFSLDLIFKLPKHTMINNHAIKLVNG